MVEHPPYKWDKKVRFFHEVPSFVSVDVEKAGTRNPCEMDIGPVMYQLLLRTSNPNVYWAKWFRMREAELLTNSICNFS